MAEQQFIISGHAFTCPKLAPALYLVSTPIGNLKDISIRALETLAGSDLVLCEDTRTSAKLLNAYGIKTQKASLHEHNETAQAQNIVDEVIAGKAICLISDAGTPLISDPGFPLVRVAAEKDIPIIAIPGASAVLSALAVSGLPTDSFCFYGFLPPKQQARLSRLDELKDQTATLVFYESPKRTAATLSAVAEVFGATRQIVVARELTKRFETLYRGTAGELATQFEGENVKGEVVILSAGADKTAAIDPGEWRDALRELMDELPLRGAVDKIAADFGLKRKQVYQTALELKNED
ncbi:16S rRNA (cytidine(1402)-2'-O)-methyltransferase [Maritalea porphyrae]|uniref:Ribosomal RNA small subunit methyltransferase I n=1 Tax=Maritalea porphyrae TaxID=880732 RepID=A0ABQ5USG5_9HYPH|nr:16S rRNA (cytidine(1402)-2'-O)-methyltransferase [Maritalea porphyrae]GLQ16897.1 ribosomal RNA small subunit methyltransferase I [Maritalea porphyrae]